MAITIDGSRMVAGSADGTAIVWDLVAGELLHTLIGHEKLIMTVGLTADGRAVTGSADGTAIVWDLDTGELLHTLTGHSDSIEAVAITADDSRALTVSEDGKAVVWDLSTGQPTANWYGDAGMKAAAWIPGRPAFIVGDLDGAVHILGLRASRANDK